MLVYMYIVLCTSVIKSQLPACNCSIPVTPIVNVILYIIVTTYCPPYSTEAHLYSATCG